MNLRNDGQREGARENGCQGGRNGSGKCLLECRGRGRKEVEKEFKVCEMSCTCVDE